MLGVDINPSSSLSFAVVLTALIAAAITDIREFKVYNALTFPLVLSGLLFHSLAPSGLGWEATLGGFALGFGLLFLPFVLGGIGAGDVKLMAGVGAWLGPHMTLVVFSLSGLAAGALSLLMMVRHGGFREMLLRLRIIYYQIICLSRYVGSEDRVEDCVHRADRRRRVIPFAAMICFGVLSLVAAVAISSRQ